MTGDDTAAQRGAQKPELRESRIEEYYECVYACMRAFYGVER